MSRLALIDDIPDPHYPITYLDRAWLIEAPLNSVEVLEAILKPPCPYKIYTARPIRQHRWGPLNLKQQRRQDNEGKLFQDREISFVIVGPEELSYLERWFDERGFFTQFLPHMSIPWVDSGGKRLTAVNAALFSNYRNNGLTPRKCNTRCSERARTDRT
jgi:hypothetical protein